VVLEGLDNVEVGALALREAVLAVELELGSDNGVLSPAVHVKSSLREDEGSGVRDVRTSVLGCTVTIEGGVRNTGGGPLAGSGEASRVTSTSHLEEAVGGDEGSRARCLSRSTEGVDGVGKSIDGISVVEGLGTKSSVKGHATLEGRAVVDVGIRLDNPDKLLARVVEVEFDLVRGRTDRLVTRELNLLNEVFVGVLSHLAALIRVKEDIVDVERGSNERLLVSSRNGLGKSGGR